MKETVGYNQARGDTVNVVNAAFTETKTEMEIPVWKDPENVAMAKSLLKNLIVFGLAFYLVFGVLRPLLRDLVKPPEAVTPEGMEMGVGGERGMAGTVGRVGHAREDTYSANLARVKEFAKTNPQITADIIKEWMTKE